MKKFKKLFLMMVIPAIVIISAYIGFDYWRFVQQRNQPQPVLNMAVFRPAIVGPVIPHDKLPRRKFIEIGGQQFNEKDYTRVLVLDLNKDGIALCGLTDLKQCAQWPKENFFDFNHDGFNEATPYLGKDDVLLLYPVERDEKASEIGRDIIGTYFQNNKDGSLGAFEVLRGLAGEKERLSPDDDLFEKLYVWRYGFGNEILAPQSLSAVGIEELSLNVIPNREILPSGNILGDYAEVRFADGSRGKLQEVWLLNNYAVVNRSSLPENEKTRGIPNVSGMGTVLPLRDAVTQDESGKLEALVRQYMREPNYFVREALLPEIIYLWSGVTEVNPLSRISEDGINYVGDARKIAAVEKFHGKPFRGTHSFYEETPNPHHQSVYYVWNAFTLISDLLRTHLDLAGILLLEENHDVGNLKDKIAEFQQQHGEFQAKLLLNASVCERLKGADMNLPCEKLVINGTSQRDVLTGEKNKDNIFIGRYGIDILTGGQKDDIYIYGRYDGGDVIKESGGYDRIMLIADILPEMIRFEKIGSSLIIRVSDNGDAIMVHDFGVSPKNQVEELVFADGKTVYLSKIYAKLSETESPLPLLPEFLSEAGKHIEIENDRD